MLGRTGARRRGPAERPDHAAVLPLRLDEAGKQRVHREPLDVPGVDAAEKRLRQVVGRLRPEAAAEERPDRLLRGLPAADGSRFGGASSSRPRRSRPRRESSRWAASAPEAGGYAEDGAAGQRVQCSIPHDVRGARRARRDEAAGEAELLAECDRRRFLRDERVRSRVDGEPAGSVGADHAAEAIGFLEQYEGRLPAVELVGRRQSADASADDGDGDVAHARLPSDSGAAWAARGRRGGSASAALVDEAGQGLHMRDRRLREDAVTEVEDVAGLPADAPQDVVGAGEKAVDAPEEQRRIQVSPAPPVPVRCEPRPRRWGRASRRR